MRYFVPNIRAAAEAEAGSEKFGGRPWGLASSKWPKCAECGKSQSLLAQLKHDPARLDLGRHGRVLYVFQCNHDPGMCSTWEAFSGANACFVVEPEDLTGGATPIPDDRPPLDLEVCVTGWLERDDGLESTIADAFKNDRDYLELPQQTLQHVTWSTRVGSVPRWLQSADDAPKDGWRFAVQLDATYSFLERPSPIPDWVQTDAKGFEGRTHIAEGPNFGFGLGYVFLRPSAGVPDGCFLWQR